MGEFGFIRASEFYGYALKVLYDGNEQDPFVGCEIDGTGVFI